MASYYDLPRRILAVLALRRHAPLSRYRQRHAMRRRLEQAPQRPSFWKRLCAVLWPGEAPPPQEDLRSWLELPAAGQWQAVLQAWCLIPRHPAARKRRRKLIARFRQQASPLLCAAERRELPGWRYLGLWDGEHLTPLGTVVFGHAPPPPPPSPRPWRIVRDCLVLSFPARWLLLWRLEAFLEPRAPGVYPLDERALNRLPAEGSADCLWDVLAQGLGHSPPKALRARLERAQALHILPGLVLEFPNSEVLRRLRRDAPLRRRLEYLLSPCHALLAPRDRRSLETLLARRGIRLLEGAPPMKRKSRMQRPSPVPPLALPLPGEDLTAALEAAIRARQAVHILYRAPGPVSAPEWRHITPLLLETRGAHTYLSAYCHERRANRLFRLDRILPVPAPGP